MVYFGNLGPFDDAMGKMGAPWWRNDKWDPLIMWWGIRDHNGPIDDTVMNWDPLITWLEIRGYHFDDIMRKVGALNGAMEI